MPRAMPPTTAPTQELVCRPMGGGGRTTPWGTKSQRTLSISEDCWSMVTFLATHYLFNRSEVIEIVIRLAYENNLDLAKIRASLLEPTDPRMVDKRHLPK